ncbi:CarD family transcriptional regulator [Bacillus andreraoultii]|uniref:CarD family transcriptional regulator n=1 Tax=Bacillus andreraoultii TaxID=1499685 RepID=UPI00053A5103|nr:CarD family transcriptional regulator [Bacillus andreraoultii]
MFQVGEKVFYPLHGAGEIQGIENKEVLGKVQPYYLIKIPCSNMDVMIPVANARKLGVRPLTDPMILKELLLSIKDYELDNETPWKDKFKLIMEKIKSGDIEDTAIIYKYLMARSKEKMLNTNEKALLSRVQKFLVSEICMIQDINENEAEHLLIS